MGGNTIDGPTTSTTSLTQIGTSAIASAAITASKLAANSVGTNNIVNSSVTLSKLGSDVPKRLDTEIFHSALVVVPAGYTTFIDVSCPSDLPFATGGGFQSLSVARDVPIIVECIPINVTNVSASSGPSTGWEIGAHNPTVYDINMYAFAVCSNITP